MPELARIELSFLCIYSHLHGTNLIINNSFVQFGVGYSTAQSRYFKRSKTGKGKGLLINAIVISTGCFNLGYKVHPNYRI